MKRISTDQIIEIHRQLTGQTGGAEGIRDMNLLDSAVMSPFQTFGGTDLYPDLHTKAAQMGYQLINGEKIAATDKEKIDLGLGVAQGALKPGDICQWLDTHTRLI
ncbi:hypothetical protein FACS1894110_06510 [Spirochaetia bacterium]|nr:hypothetical protein FACS1894110_06510 [Spirochaetia bacterium]